MCPGQLAKQAELPRCFEDTFAKRPGPQGLRQGVGIALVVLLPPTLRDPGHHDLVHVWAQRLVEPGTLQTLFEDQVLATRNHPDRLDQGLAVGLDREVLQPLARLGNDRERAARCVHIQSDVPFHRWCLLSLGIDESPTRGSPRGSGDTTSRLSPDSRPGPQTPRPYDAYPHTGGRGAPPRSASR